MLTRDLTKISEPGLMALVTLARGVRDDCLDLWLEDPQSPARAYVLEKAHSELLELMDEAERRLAVDLA